MLEATCRSVRVVVASNARHVLSQIEPLSMPYLLDINSVTAPVGAALFARRRSFVVDTGDDPAALARGRSGAGVALARGGVERLLLGRARAVVCRGSFHQPVLRAKTDTALWWAPDTVPDEILDGPERSVGSENVVSTFGSASSPARGDRAYGWEVIDLVASSPSLTGIIVVNGDGIEALQQRAARMGVDDRVNIERARPLADLVKRLAPAGFVTSVQSDDLAGWVRTTGKLPIALGSGKVLVTTRVGEASRVLPARFLVETGSDDELILRMRSVIEQGVAPGWADEARELAETFRRSRVAAGLRSFLDSL
jgi:hypothetical protein